MNMPFLKDIPPFIFFTGKGGVGKTSLACATAVWLADQGKRTLLVSTDPASNVGQVFSQTIGHRITDISTVENLAAMEVDPMAAAQAYRDRVLDPVRGLMPADVVSSIEEQLSGSCTTEIAAFDEFTGLLTNHELREKYDHIVFDTAPTGHTIRMLELPGAWSGYLEANPDAAANLGPLVGLEKQQHQYSDAVKALSDAALTRLVLVDKLPASLMSAPKRITIVGIRSSPPATPSKAATFPMKKPAITPAITPAIMVAIPGWNNPAELSCRGINASENMTNDRITSRSRMVLSSQIRDIFMALPAAHHAPIRLPASKLMTISR